MATTADITFTSDLAGVDPGLRSGGLVFIDPDTDGAIVESHSMVETAAERAAATGLVAELFEGRGNWGDREFSEAVIRGERWRDDFFAAFDAYCDAHGHPAAVAVESFVDQPSKAKKIQARRWQTPLLIGMLITGFAERGYTVANGRLIFQNAGTVIRQHSNELMRLEERNNATFDVVVKNDHLLTNDHQRKAWAHADALSLRITTVRPSLGGK